MTTTPAPAIEIRDLRHRYGSAVVLRGLDLDVAPGHTTAVLGPSGCGKTTLLRAVAGFLRPDGGTIALDGDLVFGPGRSLPPRARRIGYVAQEGALFPHLDVAGNVAFGLDREGLGSRARSHAARVDELLELVGLDLALRDRMPHQLSGGQQQRVALARALAPDPAVILLDEPFSSLDTQSREETSRATTTALRARGITTVLITHDPAEAMSLADSVAVLDGGVVAQHASPQEIYRRPATLAVARTLGAANLLAARAEGERAETALGSLLLVHEVGNPSAGSGAGDAAYVVVRPEQVRVTSDRLADGVTGEVVESSFHGFDHVVRVRLDGGDVVTSRSTTDLAPAVGDVVGVGVEGSVHLIGPAPAPDPDLPRPPR